MHFGHRERRQLQIGDAPGQSLRRLFQQFDRCRTEQQELAGADSAAPTLVDETSQHLEDSWRALDFVEDHQAVLVA